MQGANVAQQLVFLTAAFTWENVLNAYLFQWTKYQVLSAITPLNYLSIKWQYGNENNNIIYIEWLGDWVV